MRRSPSARGSGYLLISLPVVAAIWLSCTPERPAADSDRPQEVLSWRHQMLPRERYEELAGEWERYVADHPGDARALVEWGDALRYSGKRDEALEKYEQAFAADSTDAAAVEKFAFQSLHNDAEGEWSLAASRLKRALQAEPDFAELYYSVWSVGMREGDDDLAKTCLRNMVDSGDMPRPLFDFGYNMIAGAPENAIIFTNGDNDTYPPLAYQAVTGSRADVSIVNLSLLNTHWYARRLVEDGIPLGIGVDDVASLQHSAEEGLISRQLQKKLFETLDAQGWPRPLYYCVTVAEQNKALKARFAFEGILIRVLPARETAEMDTEAMDVPVTRRLLDTVYRLDSATDPLVDWERESSVAMLTRNYVSILRLVAHELLGEERKEAAGGYLYKAVAIGAFHDRELARALVAEWEEADPESELLALAKKFTN